MLQPSVIVSALEQLGYSWFSGVPCSFFGSLVDYLGHSTGPNYFGAASEGEALAISTGAFLAGRRTAVMCQNSGLGNIVNPITSMNFPFLIPSLLFVSWRGEPSIRDEPQHEHMGRSTLPLLNALNIPWRLLPKNDVDMQELFAEAVRIMDRTSLPFCLVIRKDTLAQSSTSDLADPKPLRSRLYESGQAVPELSREDVLNAVLETASARDAVVATTGMTSRELYTIADRASNFYVVGSMGAAAAIGFGITTVQPKRRMIILDGDGSLLMRLGTLATIGFYKPSSFIHIVLDNEAHDSTGGQRTASVTCRFAAMAAAANYASAYSVCNKAELITRLDELRREHGPAMLHVKIKKGITTQALRPKLSATEIKERFMSFLSDYDP